MTPPRNADTCVVGSSESVALPNIRLAQVSRDVYVLHPPDNSARRPDHPKVVLIFGWMDGKSKSFTGYMSKYQSLYPGTTQVLVLSRASSLWTSEQKNLEAVRPVMDILNSVGFFGAEPPSVLVHAFSNGGGQQLLLLSDLLRHVPKGPDGEPMQPVGALIFDSLPGNGKLRTALRAYTASIKAFPLKLLAAMPLTIIWCIIMGTGVLLGKPDPMTSLRDGLNNPHVLPWTNGNTPRVYIYGTDDQIIPSYAIEEHIQNAKSQKGLQVKDEQFEGSTHVSHAKKDPDRYWVIVRDTWEEALKARASL